MSFEQPLNRAVLAVLAVKRFERDLDFRMPSSSPATSPADIDRRPALYPFSRKRLQHGVAARERNLALGREVRPEERRFFYWLPVSFPATL